MRLREVPCINERLPKWDKVLSTITIKHSNIHAIYLNWATLPLNLYNLCCSRNSTFLPLLHAFNLNCTTVHTHSTIGQPNWALWVIAFASLLKAKQHALRWNINLSHRQERRQCLCWTCQSPLCFPGWGGWGSVSHQWDFRTASTGTWLQLKQ